MFAKMLMKPSGNQTNDLTRSIHAAKRLLEIHDLSTEDLRPRLQLAMQIVWKYFLNLVSEWNLNEVGTVKRVFELKYFLDIKRFLRNV